MSGKDKNLHNMMTESESEQEDVGKEGIEWIMNLPDVPMKLPPHVELQRTRVECKADAPIHVLFVSISHYLVIQILRMGNILFSMFTVVLCLM